MSFTDRDVENYYASADPAFWHSDDDAAEEERRHKVNEQRHLDRFYKWIKLYFRDISEEDMVYYRDNVEVILEAIEQEIMEDIWE